MACTQTSSAGRRWRGCPRLPEIASAPTWRGWSEWAQGSHYDETCRGSCPRTLTPPLTCLAAAGGAEGVEVAELHAPYSSQSFMLTQALGLQPGVRINPSGGAFSADTPMVAGLVRIGEAAQQVRAGAQRALAHATRPAGEMFSRLREA